MSDLFVTTNQVTFSHIVDSSGCNITIDVSTLTLPQRRYLDKMRVRNQSVRVVKLSLPTELPQ